MTKGKTNIIIIVVAITLCVVILSVAISAYFVFLHRYKGRTVINEWSAEQEFDISKVATVNKQKGKEFVILNLADVQMADLEDLCNMNTIHQEISYLVQIAKPDLITLTGDQTWSNENLIGLTSLIRWLDGYKIPWAPVFGNHDYGNQYDSAVASLNYCCQLYEKSKYCLFDRGPTNIGALGNYVVNIMEDGKIFKTLYMIDAGYGDIITDEQIAWFSWNAEGIKQANGGQYTSAMCFMHKPLPEYAIAYGYYLNGNDDKVEGVGVVHEPNYSLYGTKQNGFFDIAKNVGVEDIVCAHQHGNNFTIKYQDVRLSFALKTGELGGYVDDGETYYNGATVFTCADNSVEINNIYAPREMFHIKTAGNK